MRTKTWVTFCLLLSAAFSIHAETRVALVIGNGAYEHAAHLRNPVQDAHAIAAAFRGLGYSVQLVEDARLPGMQAALSQFARAAAGADQAVVYYSGHGIEVGGVNYLLPVEASIATERTVALEAVPLPAVMDIAAAARRLGLVVLDACRDNPLANSMTHANGTKSASRGLGRVEPTGNLLVAYATKDGQVASDGAGPNSPYTTAILEALKVPGLEVQLFWRKVHDSVLSATGRAQEPFTYGALGAEALYLNPPGSASGNNQFVAPPRPSSDQSAVELALWHSAEKLGTEEGYREYLAQYPQGKFSRMANLQVAALTRHSAAPAVPPLASIGRPSEPDASVARIHTVSVKIAPPLLPVYVQPACPQPGYIWIPGYWAWGLDGYYWVPGTWVEPPEVGLLWTPGYWAWEDGAYWWYRGYWGPHVGFYGGINYGFGYMGAGFVGGEWRGREFYYNRSIANVEDVQVNTYERSMQFSTSRVMFNGGAGGIVARPSACEMQVAHDRHIDFTAEQSRHEQEALHNNAMRASVNGGRPSPAATARSGEF
jgi:hypothetical protein